MPLLGAHMSVAGGLQLAITRIARVGGRALQIFTRNQRQWQTLPISAEERADFAAAWQSWGNWPIASHTSYLINLASPDAEVRRKSVLALTAELERSAALAIPFVVMHPGSHGGDGAEQGLIRLVCHLDQAFAAARGAEAVMVLLENTAGQGNALGATFNELAFLLTSSAFADRLGLCLDTCHLFAAGHDLRNAAAYHATMAAIDRTCGITRVKFFHLNDSQRELGSRVDRHEHIGQGHIGLAGFRLLLNDPRFRHHPMTLETPKGSDLAEDIVNLRTLRALLTDTLNEEHDR
ncbi:MAG: deoxyribonuclease IV [Thermodesulfobacteriota bacterium]